MRVIFPCSVKVASYSDYVDQFERKSEAVNRNFELQQRKKSNAFRIDERPVVSYGFEAQSQAKLVFKALVNINNVERLISSRWD